MATAALMLRFILELVSTFVAAKVFSVVHDEEMVDGVPQLYTHRLG